MTTTTQYPHITIDDAGIARIGNSRYKVLHLASEHYHYGWSAEELLRQHPDLRPEEVYAALTYTYDHYDAIVADLAALQSRTDSEGDAAPLSRDELLRRKKLTEPS